MTFAVYFGNRGFFPGELVASAIAFIESEMKLASKDPEIRHIVLVSHWSIVTGNPDFKLPILDACKENKFNGNRRRLLDLRMRRARTRSSSRGCPSASSRGRFR